MLVTLLFPRVLVIFFNLISPAGDGIAFFSAESLGLLCTSGRSFCILRANVKGTVISTW